MTTAEILVALAAAPTENWMDPDVGANARGWPMLPVHPKIAHLFFNGLNLMAGFHLGNEILSLIPVAFVNERELLEGQLRAGVTRTAAGVDSSVLMRAWVRIDPYNLPAITDWYFALLASAAPVASSSTNSNSNGLATLSTPNASNSNSTGLATLSTPNASNSNSTGLATLSTPNASNSNSTGLATLSIPNASNSNSTGLATLSTPNASNSNSNGLATLSTPNASNPDAVANATVELL
jgi:hypothetical protein